MGKKRSLQAARSTVHSTSQIVKTIIKAIQEKKGHEIVALDLRKTGNSFADYFVVCHGDSTTQTDAIAESVEKMVAEKHFEHPFHVEGTENAEWILLDYFSVIVHVFLKEKREFYGLERLWADAQVKKVANS